MNDHDQDLRGCIGHLLNRFRTLTKLRTNKILFYAQYLAAMDGVELLDLHFRKHHYGPFNPAIGEIMDEMVSDSDAEVESGPNYEAYRLVTEWDSATISRKCRRYLDRSSKEIGYMKTQKMLDLIYDLEVVARTAKSEVIPLPLLWLPAAEQELIIQNGPIVAQMMD